MSLPSPPTGGPFSPTPSVAGLSDSARSSTRFSNGSALSSQSSFKAPGKSAMPLAHIQDLQQRAVEGLDRNTSIANLVTTAENALRQACTLLEYRKPDLAYTEYLRCYEILVTFIYKNPGFPDFKNRRNTTYSRYSHLLKRLTARDEQFKSVKEIIEADNKRNGTQPRLSTTSAPALGQAIRFEEKSRSLLQGHDNARLAQSGSTMSDGQGSDSVGALNERFARLRGPTLDTGAALSQTRSRESATSPSSLRSPTLASDAFRNSISSSSRPNGPRSMNGYNQFPESMSFDAKFAAAMPQPPTPAYSPARNMQIAGGIDLPRSSARSIVGTGGRSNSIASASSASAVAPGGDADSGYFPKVPPPRKPPPVPPARRKSVHLPYETMVGAERLYDYLKMHNILLIDCRPRDQFDDGHIYHSAVMCIEPAALRKDMSADQVQDSLILSPDEEQVLFATRDQFDLVVYYDASTKGDSYLKNPRTDDDFSLRYLHDALLEFNAGKPLQRPPILLTGGIAAWTDLVGRMALKSSMTTQSAIKPRPIRLSAVPKMERLSSSMRRLRDYNPLDAEEELSWRERARKESVVVEPRPEILEEPQQVDDEAMLASIAEFNRRFPDAASIGKPVLEYEPSPRPQAVRQSFDYPVAPSSSSVSTIPPVPARPAPAAPRMSYSGVNERSVSQSRSVDLPPYIPTHLQPANLRLPKTGLVNPNITCYMNATIQALSATLPLTALFLEDRYKSMVQPDNWKGTKGVLPDLYANLIRNIWNGQSTAIRPTTLRAFCTRLNSEWGKDRQQDAKEFFDFIVDCLHEDLNINWSRTALRALTEEQEIKREAMLKPIVSKMEWERYTHREQSMITDLFAGQHSSRLKCTVCDFTSTTYEAFFSISVEIPRTGRASIQDCLESYCREEMLSGDEVWKCPRCKKQREATKQITITRAPQHLVVHFKRFAADKNGSTKKVRTPIDFPLTDFDLEPYMLPSPSGKDKEAMAAKGIKQDVSTTAPYMYDAYAVMRHMGATLSSGHYTCLSRDKARKCWRQYNDAIVGDFDPDRLNDKDRVTNDAAYIVFYERKT